jgi:hypothetical protein
MRKMLRIKARAEAAAAQRSIEPSLTSPQRTDETAFPDSRNLVVGSSGVGPFGPVLTEVAGVDWHPWRVLPCPVSPPTWVRARSADMSRCRFLAGVPVRPPPNEPPGCPEMTSFPLRS